MKALILAAGLGTRLRPLTSNIPKPLVPILGRPLLGYHLDSLRSAGIREILVNTHYLASQVDEFVEDYLRQFPEVKIQVVFEPKLLGSAGTLRANESFFEKNDILVIYADNLTNLNYKKLISHHQAHKQLATIAVYNEPRPENKGVVLFDLNKNIFSFLEKPGFKPSEHSYANAGIYVLNPGIFQHLLSDQPSPFDFGRHVFPYLLNKQLPLNAYIMEEFLLDIGSVESYTKAQEFAKDLFT